MLEAFNCHHMFIPDELFLRVYKLLIEKLTVEILDVKITKREENVHRKRKHPKSIEETTT
jgi:hypothetical protein